MFLKYNTAVTVCLGPFVDITDGVTVEDGLTIPSSQVWVSKIGGTPAAKASPITLTVYTQGLYACALSAADVNTVGNLQIWVQQVANALAVFHNYVVLPANVYDSFVAGTDALQVHTNEMTAGIITAGVIATDAITSATLAASAGNELGAAIWAVATRTLSASAISATIIDSGAITSAKFAASAFTAGVFATDAITAAKIAADAGTEIGTAVWAVATRALTAGAISATIIDSGAITSAKFADSAITAGVFATDAITAAKIADNAIDAGAIASDAITAAKIASGAITSAKFAASAITAGVFATDAITTTTLAATVASEFADSVWDEARADHVSAGTFGLSVAKGITKNAAFSNLMFLMVSSTDHRTPTTLLTVTGYRSIDGAAFGSCATSIAEIGNGIYQYDAPAADVNGDMILFRFVASGADDTFVTVYTTS